jgi:hypothetical protein
MTMNVDKKKERVKSYLVKITLFLKIISENDMIKMLELLIDKIFVIFGGCVIQYWDFFFNIA